VDAVYSKDNNFPGFLARSGLQHVSLYRCDLSDAEQVRALADVLPKRFDTILYLAADPSPVTSKAGPAAVSMSGPIGFTTLLSSVHSDRLVYLSSGAVYEGLCGEVGPQLSVAPCLPYAVSKLACEACIPSFRDTGYVGGYVTLRLFAAYGRFEAPRRLSTRLVRWAAGGAREAFEIHGDGGNLIDMMYVSDVVRGIKKVIASEVSDEVVDFATGKPLSINNFVQRSAEILGVQGAPVRHVGEAAGYQEFVASSRMMEKLFDFRPEIPLEQGLLELKEHLITADNSQ
jgi:nucleoside-diphosphate-sugar epimerase